MQALGRTEHVEAVGTAHLEIAHDDVEIVFVQLFDRRVAVAGFFDVMTGSAQRERQPSPQRVVIVGDKYSAHLNPCYVAHACVSATGNVTRNVVPRSGTLETSMRPSCASTIL